MKKYIVVAPLVVFTIRQTGKENTDYTQKKGDTVELPEDNIAVRAMLSRGQIKEVAGNVTKATENETKEPENVQKTEKNVQPAEKTTKK